MLDDGEETLFRQIHPTFVDNGEPSSQAFRPTPKDNGKLSVDRSALTTADKSFSLYVTNGYASQSVYGVSVSEFGESNILCYPDPIDGSEGKLPNPAHCFADYSDIPASKQKTLAQRIKLMAIKRGCLYRPSP